VVLVSEQDHVDAVKAALTAAGAHPYTYAELAGPEKRPQVYTEVSVTRRAGAPNRNTADTTRGGWRITTRVVALYSDDIARTERDAVYAGLLYARLVVGGKPTKVQLESEEQIGSDDGWYSGLTAWTYAN